MYTVLVAAISPIFRWRIGGFAVWVDDVHAPDLTYAFETAER
jgi:hypothetical protein